MNSEAIFKQFVCEKLGELSQQIQSLDRVNRRLQEILQQQQKQIVIQRIIPYLPPPPAVFSRPPPPPAVFTHPPPYLPHPPSQLKQEDEPLDLSLISLPRNI